MGLAIGQSSMAGLEMGCFVILFSDQIPKIQLDFAMNPKFFMASQQISHADLQEIGRAHV